MKAAPDDQLRLLEVQALDTTLTRLAHRLRTLPELAQLTALADRRRSLTDEIVVAETEDSDLGREQQKVDTDVELVRARMQRDQQRLDSGAGAPRELENLQHEVGSLRRRQSELEDAELEVMEQREQVQTRLAGLRDQQRSLDEDMATATTGRDAATTEIAEQQQVATADREQRSASIPTDLLALYDRIRDQSGTGAAALHRGQCEGCHLSINTIDLNRLRDAPGDEVQRCEECRRILIRTAESGL